MKNDKKSEDGKNVIMTCPSTGKTFTVSIDAYTIEQERAMDKNGPYSIFMYFSNTDCIVSHGPFASKYEAIRCLDKADVCKAYHVLLLNGKHDKEEILL